MSQETQLNSQQPLEPNRADQLAQSGTQVKPGFRAGLAVLVGRTNAGKSTLLNRILGTKVSIVTPKPQTTRDPIHGVVHMPEGQIVFVDTPGFFKTHPSKLVDQLHKKAREALQDIDVVVHVADPTRAIGPEDEMVLEALSVVTKPKILCLNKCDVSERPFLDEWRKRADEYVEVVETSGVTGAGVEELKQAILRHLPEGPPLYPEDQVTNATREFLISELIREKVYLMTGQEVPYRTAVEVDLVRERTDRNGNPLIEIKASILTANDRYQRMLIGAGGRKVKEIGTAVRKELEQSLGKKVFLDLDVIVDKRLLI